MKILLADDDTVSRRMMERALQQCGYKVVTASNGREAVEILSQADSPRLALIDWVMPELDGPAVCRIIRDRHDEAYVYMTLLTSKESKEDIVAGLSSGADDFLTKPCNAEELKARLRTGHRILELEDKLVAAREEMRFKATHDSLTSLWNRGAIIALLKSELHRSMRTRKPLSILLCDIDHFKLVNDLHGHNAGDDVLQQVACRLLKSVRSYDAVGRYGDSVGRYGGEEFLLLLSDCDATQIINRAEHVRTSIASHPCGTQGGPISITLSIGAMTVTDWDNSLTLEPLLNQVDIALYRAKSEGRNRVVYTDAPGFIQNSVFGALAI
jgi:two-component system cell cycle response regulator